MGGFVHRHSNKVTELDQFGGLRVLLRQRVERLMDGQQFVGGGCEDEILVEVVVGEFEVKRPCASLLALSPARMFHQDSSHGLGGCGEKVRSVLPGSLLRTDQPEPGFVHERRGLESMAGGFARHLVGGDASEFLVDQWEKFLGGPGIALIQGAENARDVVQGFTAIRVRLLPG